MPVQASPFLGIAYRLRSKTLADQRLINLYPEIVEGKSGSAEVGGFYGCPGLRLVTTLPSGPVRGLLTKDSALFAVAGGVAYSLDTSYNATNLGAMATMTGPVSMINNPAQVAIFDSLGGYSYSGGGAGTLAPIALPFTGSPGIAAYQDGFGVLTQVGTFDIWQSNIDDLTTWDPTDFTTEDGSADAVTSIIEFHNQFAVFKQGFLCFYVNAGLSGFVFQRLQGIYAETGCEAPYSVAQADETLIWLGQNPEGGNVVYTMRGYEPERASTHALEYEISQYTTTADAIAFTYQQEGHFFYVITFPTAGKTWCLDLTASKQMGVPAWHERAGFSNGQFMRFAANCFAYFNGQLLVGDYASGNIYAMDLDTYTDNGQPRKWLRSWRALGKAMYEPAKFNFLELAYESGIGVLEGANPQFMLRYSDDSYNWSAELYAAAGAIGETGNTARWNRLGQTRRSLNSDRIFELSSTDQFKVALLGASIG